MINRGIKLHTENRELPSENEIQDMVDLRNRSIDWEVPPIDQLLERCTKLLSRVKLTIFGHELDINLFKADEYIGKVTIQIQFEDKWRGRRWIVTDSMSDDEIIKTCYAAFEASVKHEIMKGFTIDDKILFDPNKNFEELIK